MVEHFGDNWQSNPQIRSTLIEVLSVDNKRLVRVPLVDVGPGAAGKEVDLTMACDQFLKTDGEGSVSYRLLVPTPVA
jgi:hypothetical protein